IAARAGVSVGQLAASNGLDPNGLLLSGATLQLSGSSSGTAVPVSTGSSAPSTSGAYLVQPGDTLSAIAARAGLSVAQLAVSNGLDPNGTLLAGTALRVSGSAAPASTATAETQPVGTAAQ